MPRVSKSRERNITKRKTNEKPYRKKYFGTRDRKESQCGYGLGNKGKSDMRQDWRSSQ